MRPVACRPATKTSLSKWPCASEPVNGALTQALRQTFGTAWGWNHAPSDARGAAGTVCMPRPMLTGLFAARPAKTTTLGLGPANNIACLTTPPATISTPLATSPRHPYPSDPRVHLSLVGGPHVSALFGQPLQHRHRARQHRCDLHRQRLPCKGLPLAHLHLTFPG